MNKYFKLILCYYLQLDTSDTQVSVYYKPLEISIKALTVWGSSGVVTIFSPISSESTNIKTLYSQDVLFNQTEEIPWKILIIGFIMICLMLIMLLKYGK